MFRTARRTAALTIAATGIAVLAGVGIASAHIQTDPPAIEAGKQTTLGFIVEHGCADEDTTGLDIKLPTAVTDATATEDGWQVAVSDGVVRFSGGDQDAHTSKTFHITFTAPAVAGVAVFPTVQHCGEVDTSWLDVQAAGEAEPEHPAPMVNVTQGPPTSDELVIPTDDDEDDASGETAAPGTVIATATATTTPAVTLVPTVTTPASSSSDDDSNTGVIVVIVVVVVGAALGIAGIVVTRRRRDGSGRPSGGS